jgi:alanyl-tRNA synthetase
MHLHGLVALRRGHRYFWSDPMTTERLYFQDAYLRHFSAHVVAHRGQGGQHLIALDQSAFYPEGGGQPADTGTLGGAQVLDVQSDEDGAVWHYLAAPLGSETLQGEVNWERRFDHMQQHHGQHLLSAAFEQLYSMKTISFHLGTATVTIDLAAPQLSAEQAVAVEELVNQVIWEDRPVLARFVSAAELATIPLRKPPAVSGPIRVVSVPEFDHSACGGTHPRSTGGVGLLHIRRWERRGDAIRVEFVCGGRALRDLRWKNGVLARISASLSVGSDELEGAVARLRESEDQARRGLEQARMQLLPHEARELAASAETIGELRVVRVTSVPRSLEELRALAKLIADEGTVALVGMAAEKGHLIIACGPGLPVDSGALIRAALGPLGGKGGGRPELAQGGLADPGQIAAALQYALDALQR